MKKIFLVLTLGLLAVAPSMSVLASCGSALPVANAAQAAFTGLSATPANVSCRIWIYTKGVSGTTGGGVVVAGTCPAAGCDNGTMTVTALDAPTCSEFNSSNMLYETTAGCGLAGYSVLTSWDYAGFDGCPSAADRVVILAEDNTSKYSVISRSSGGTQFDLDTVATQVAASYPSISSITRTSAGGVTPAVFDVALTGLPANGNGGYAAADAPAGPVISGYEIYYQNAVAPPSVALPGSWTLCTNGTIAGATTASATGVQAPLPGAGNTYLLVRMTFDSGFKANYGSAVYTSFGPTAAPVFASFAADASSATWTSGTETRVSSYQVYWATTANGNYQATGLSIAPKGDNQTYSSSYRVLTTANTYFVKVKATKTDGTFEFSAPVQVSKSTKTTATTKIR